MVSQKEKRRNIIIGIVLIGLFLVFANQQEVFPFAIISNLFITSITLTDIISNNADLDGPVGGYSSSPLIVADFGIKGNEAASVMAAHNIKRLGLIKEGKLVGIITARDIVDAYQNGYQISNPWSEQIGG